MSEEARPNWIQIHARVTLRGESGTYRIGAIDGQAVYLYNVSTGHPKGWYNFRDIKKAEAS